MPSFPDRNVNINSERAKVALAILGALVGAFLTSGISNEHPYAIALPMVGGLIGLLGGGLAASRFVR